MRCARKASNAGASPTRTAIVAMLTPNERGERWPVAQWQGAARLLRCGLDIEEHVSGKQDKAKEHGDCADNYDRNNRLGAREHETHAHHEHRQAEVVQPEMQTGEAG